MTITKRFTLIQITTSYLGFQFTDKNLKFIKLTQKAPMHDPRQGDTSILYSNGEWLIRARYNQSRAQIINYRKFSLPLFGNHHCKSSSRRLFAKQSTIDLTKEMSCYRGLLVCWLGSCRCTSRSFAGILAYCLLACKLPVHTNETPWRTTLLIQFVSYTKFFFVRKIHPNV